MLPLAFKCMRQEDGPAGERRLRGLRAAHFAQLAAAGYDRTSRRGVVEWAATLLAYKLLLRGGEIGGPEDREFDPARDITWASIRWLQPAAVSKASSGRWSTWSRSRTSTRGTRWCRCRSGDGKKGGGYEGRRSPVRLRRAAPPGTRGCVASRPRSGHTGGRVRRLSSWGTTEQRRGRRLPLGQWRGAWRRRAANRQRISAPSAGASAEQRISATCLATAAQQFARALGVGRRGGLPVGAGRQAARRIGGDGERAGRRHGGAGAGPEPARRLQVKAAGDEAARADDGGTTRGRAGPARLSRRRGQRTATTTGTRAVTPGRATPPPQRAAHRATARGGGA
eukprot:6185134-Pleurochrysis_carterae.AAC.1